MLYYSETKHNLHKLQDLYFFNSIISHSKVVGKELADLRSILNTSYYASLDPPMDIRYFDISFFNNISRKKYITAKLEITYIGVIKELTHEDYLLDNNASLISIFDMTKAHNPICDSIMALIIAIYIIKKLI